MTISPQLTFAILSMDTDNRGGDPSAVGLGGLSSAIGNMVFLTDSETLPQTSEAGQVAGFYAAAYQDADGNIVISYRGTDVIPEGDGTAWTGGGGFLTNQAKLAAQFCYQVQQAYHGKTIPLTGHSLGGRLGLAA